MPRDIFINKCLAETLDGLRDGLSLFSGPSRAAVIYAMTADAPAHIYDPQSLLQGHEPKLRELYLKSDRWRHPGPIDTAAANSSLITPEDNLQLAGLISCGGRSGSVFYQMWFTEHHPDMCAIGPTERWLEHAAWRFAHDLANQEHLYTGISGSFLREYAMHAVRDYILDEMNLILGWDSNLRIYPILDAVLAISKTREEKAWPRGELAFVETQSLGALSFAARFTDLEQPRLENYKHTRKLLQSVEDSDRKLISDGQMVVGIAFNQLPRFSIVADFRGRHGFLRLGETPVCSFAGGSFQSLTHRAKLVQVEETLIESDLDPDAAHTLFKVISGLVHSAEKQKHGSTIVVDLNDPPIAISGQRLDRPLDLRQPDLFELAMALSKVDGALHVGADLGLHGFACLLDGKAIPGEDRARGARFNSALRFTAQHNRIMVVVVSVDHPVSVIQEGVEVSAQCQWKPTTRFIAHPLTLEDWLAQAQD